MNLAQPLKKRGGADEPATATATAAVMVATKQETNVLHNL